jgi:ribosomal protein L13
MPAPSASSASEKSIVEKVKKLLALADSDKNSHEHERAVAMQAAMDLLAKHNLSMTEITAHSLDVPPEEVSANFKLEPWVRRILSASCKLYYTRYYMIGTRNQQNRLERNPVFVGTAENIAVTINVATWLLNSVRLESNRIYRDAFERRSFRLGAADRIFERACEIMLSEINSGKSAGTSLIILRNQFEKANEKHMNAKNLKEFKSRTVYLDGNAFADGEAFGNQVGLSRHKLDKTNRLPK